MTASDGRAERADSIEVRNACWRAVWLASASLNHTSVNPAGGQADVPLELKA